MSSMTTSSKPMTSSLVVDVQLQEANATTDETAIVDLQPKDVVCDVTTNNDAITAAKSSSNNDVIPHHSQRALLPSSPSHSTPSSHHHHQPQDAAKLPCVVDPAHYLNGVGGSGLKQQGALVVSNNNNNNTVKISSTSYSNTYGLSNGSSHSYYDCCINVHVSSLLDHWLDWEPSSAKRLATTATTTTHHSHAPCNRRSHCYLSNNNNNNQVVGGNNRNFRGGKFNNNKRCHDLNESSNCSSCDVSSSSEQSEDDDQDDDDLDNERESDADGFPATAAATAEWPESPDNDDEDTAAAAALQSVLSQLSSLEQQQEPSKVSVDSVRQIIARNLCRVSGNHTNNCDNINMLKDSEDKTVLHHVVTGEMFSQEAHRLECVLLLLELGANPNAADVNGDTPFLSVRHLLESGRFRETLEVVNVFTQYNYNDPEGSHQGLDLNARDNRTDQSLLAWSVRYGDQTKDLTRHLLNCGANIWNTVDKSQAILVDDSAFKALMKALMSGQTSLDAAKETVDLLSMAMAVDPDRMRGHADRCMIELGVAPKVNGPLFLRLRAMMSKHMSRPHSLMTLTRNKIRANLIKSDQPVVKRLQAGSNRLNRHSKLLAPPTKIRSITANRVCQLHLPHKLCRYICLGETTDN